MHSLEEKIHPNLVETFRVRVDKFNCTFETYSDCDHRKQLHTF